MDPIVAFVIGVLVGGGIVLVGVALRRLPAGIAAPAHPGTASAAATPPSPRVLFRTESRKIQARISRRTGSGSVQHATIDLTDSATGARIHVADGVPSIEIDGAAYDRLADVPERLRTALERDLALLRDADVPEELKSAMLALIGGDGGAASGTREV